MTNSTSRPILVTGASSGIGRHLSEFLAERGHPVYATARKKEDLDNLAQIENITPIQLDVRDSDQVQAAYEIIRDHGQGLYGLVNNAGIGALGMFVTWTDKDLLDIFNINVFGPHRITNTFVRLLISAQGRIVNIGSQGGLLTSKYFGPYTMTKHALEAYTEALHQELEPYGVSVSIVQPGGVISNIGDNSMPGILARFERATPPFDAEAQQVLNHFQNPPDEPAPDAPESESNRKPSSPEIVSLAVYDALFSKNPKRHYLVGTKWEGDRVINGLITKLLEENDNPQHNYSRDELISLLDKHIESRNNSI
jgi:short-subunit dehydrogenase